jgi:hypothetical protein
MTEKIFGAIVELIEQAEHAAARTPDPASVLAQVIRLAVESDADPYPILGVLVEGIAHTVTARVPPERQTEAAGDIEQLLTDRLAAHGIER